MKNIEIKLKKENEKYIIDEIRAYFLKEREEEISELSARLFLDFILKEIGYRIYNQAIEDATKYMSERVEDMMGLQKRPR
jgi:uncharacterized protein (DUF2164 family)